MSMEQQRKRAEQLRALHHRQGEVLVLPNAWDVISARLYEEQGFAAVATTSAGIAAVLGYPDGQRISRSEMVEAVRRIAGRLQVPLSADMEAGYANQPEGVAETVRALLGTGAAGINLEDSTGEKSQPLFTLRVQCERIAAARQAAAAAGIPLVINARTDPLLVGGGQDLDQGLRDAVERGNAYLCSGADCVFVPAWPGALDRDALARLVAELDGPLNIIADPETPPVEELAAIGVARLTFGPRPMRVALALVRRIAREWLTSGTYTAMASESLSYSEVNRMLD